MSVAINIVLILASLVLIVSVLMQEGNKQGLGVIGGAAETFLGKNKAKSAEGKLLNITRITAAVFVVLAILATWLNARTYTITYRDENGDEFFPSLASEVYLSNSLYGTSETYEDHYVESLREYIIANLAADNYESDYQRLYTSYQNKEITAAELNQALTELTQADYDKLSDKKLAKYEEDYQKSLRSKTSYANGASITTMPTPQKTGYTGKWVIDSNGNGKADEGENEALPETMGRKSYSAVPVYTVNDYTVRILMGSRSEDPAPETDEAEDAANIAAATDAGDTAAPDAEEADDALIEDSEAVAVAEEPGNSTSGEAADEAEPEVLFTFTGNYGSAIDYEGKDVTEELEGWYVFFSTDADALTNGAIYKTALPETVPAQNVDYYLHYAHGGFVKYFIPDEAEAEPAEETADSAEASDTDETADTGDAQTAETETAGSEIEWFPKLQDSIDYQQYYYFANEGQLYDFTGVYEAEVAAATENGTLDMLRTFVFYGDAITLYPVPSVPAGFVGVWEPELDGSVMDDTDHELHAVFYEDVTVTLVDNKPAEAIAEPETEAEPEETDETAAPADEAEQTGEDTTEPAEETEESTENEEAEAPADNVIFTFSGKGRTIDYKGKDVLPELEGYEVSWSEELPTVVPDENVTIYVVYTKSGEAAEDTTDAFSDGETETVTDGE